MSKIGSVLRMSFATAIPYVLAAGFFGAPFSGQISRVFSQAGQYITGSAPVTGVERLNLPNQPRQPSGPQFRPYSGLGQGPSR
jgi:hypothetical protein